MVQEALQVATGTSRGELPFRPACVSPAMYAASAAVTPVLAVVTPGMEPSAVQRKKRPEELLLGASGEIEERLGAAERVPRSPEEHGVLAFVPAILDAPVGLPCRRAENTAETEETSTGSLCFTRGVVRPTTGRTSQPTPSLGGNLALGPRSTEAWEATAQVPAFLDHHD